MNVVPLQISWIARTIHPLMVLIDDFRQAPGRFHVLQHLVPLPGMFFNQENSIVHVRVVSLSYYHLSSGHPLEWLIKTQNPASFQKQGFSNFSMAAPFKKVLLQMLIPALLAIRIVPALETKGAGYFTHLPVPVVAAHILP
jgi:hypothetical protein